MQETTTKTIEVREIRPEDSAALIDLWRRVFGDPEELAASFLRLLPEMGGGVAAFADGEPAGAAYIVTGLKVGDKRAAYLYAVAVSPPFRGMGLGERLSVSAAVLGRRLGADFVCTLPAQPGLYDWYEKRIGTRCALYRRSEVIDAHEGPALIPLSPAAYNERREELLAGLPHLSLSEAAITYESINCRCFGGGLYAVGGGIAAAYVEDGRAVLREVLCSDPAGRPALAAAAASALGCAQALLYSPGGHGDEPYLAAEPGALGTDCVWNLAFD
ncbi:MAG: GNAT family N-acetyltransferase [Oscillospiraceae bacterium]|nr:GNAT family N-acetyltransferase [Oscillospiraceae bacterium]